MIIDAPKDTQAYERKALWQEAFGDGEAFLNTFEKTAFSPDRCRCAVVDGNLAAALYWFDCSCHGRQVAYLYAIATAKRFRGKGICRALMQDTHNLLAERGYAAALLVPGEDSLFSFYEKMGYRLCSHIGEIRCSATQGPLDIREISSEEYAALRRKLLPFGGVIQENENIRFLEAQAAFYAGEKFVLAARREKDVLYGVELLGDVTVASAVTGALGCDKGRFRTPGGKTPFAMCCALGDNDFPPPAYFGLAFD